MSRGLAPTLTALALAMSVFAAPGAAGARPSSFESLAAQLLREAAPPLTALAEQGHRVGVAVTAAPGMSGPPATALLQRLGPRLASLSSGPAAVPGATAAVHPYDPATDTSRAEHVRAARRAGWTRLLRVEVGVARGRLVLLAELIPTDATLWERILRPGAPPAATFHASARLDAELRTLLQLPARPRPTRFVPMPLPGAHGAEDRVLALNVTDVDDDGADELVVLTRRTLTAYRLEEDRLTPVGAPLALTRFGGAAAPSREPMGRLLSNPDGVAGATLWAASTDIAWAIGLRWTEQGLAPLPAPAAGGESTCDGTDAPGDTLALCGFPVGEGEEGELLLQAIRPGRAEYASEFTAWTTPTDLPRPGEVRGAGGGFQRLWLKRAESGEWTLLDGRLSLRGTLRLYRRAAAIPAAPSAQQPADAEARPWRRVRSVGYAYALADFDDDGVAEVVLSSPSLPGAADSLTVLRLDPKGATERLWSESTPPVQALASGDLDDDGVIDLVAALGPETGTPRLVLYRWEGS